MVVVGGGVGVALNHVTFQEISPKIILTELTVSTGIH